MLKNDESVKGKKYFGTVVSRIVQIYQQRRKERSNDGDYIEEKEVLFSSDQEFDD